MTLRGPAPEHAAAMTALPAATTGESFVGSPQAASKDNLAMALLWSRQVCSAAGGDAFYVGAASGDEAVAADFCVGHAASRRADVS